MSAVVEVRERPILFSSEMVRALLDGRKTQTRRVANVTSENCPPGMITPLAGFVPRSPESHVSYCPYGAVGDRLWVRETWTIKNWTDRECAQMGFANAPQHPSEVYLGVPTRAVHHASWQPEFDAPYGPERWRPSIHMPRWASRITLEITGVRVERVQAITEDDAIAEGCFDEREHDGSLPSHIYRQLWDSLNAKRGYSWESNPWVWVLSFRRVTA
jgi:hypothetical protein